MLSMKRLVWLKNHRALMVYLKMLLKLHANRQKSTVKKGGGLRLICHRIFQSCNMLTTGSYERKCIVSTAPLLQTKVIQHLTMDH